MAKDHYVAQTYLKHFIDPNLKTLLHVPRKGDLKYFTPRTEDICREEGWNTNPYFENQRAVEDYLRVVEPKWNRGAGDINELLKYEEVKYFMAGYIAVMAGCSPTSVRTSSESMSDVVAASATIMARQIQAHPERFPGVTPLPQETVDRVLEAGIVANVDPKHSHARMIQLLVDLQWHFYKSPWLVLNNRTDSPFLTSDFPVGFYYPKPHSQLPYRYVPISPRSAILIKLSLDDDDRHHPREDITQYPSTTVDIADVKHDFVRLLNVLTVRGAESLVISNRGADWIANLVKKNKDWRMDSGVQRIPHGTGFLTMTQMKPRRQCHTHADA